MLKLSPSWQISLSNYLFVAAYCIIFPHALFLHEPSGPGPLHEYVILAMSIYAVFQVSGIWILSKLNDALTKSFIACAIMRSIGSVVFVFHNSLAILLGATLLAISHSIFYKQSRALASQLTMGIGDRTSLRPFFWLNITTNLSFLTAPLGGAALLQIQNASLSLASFSVLLTIIAIWLAYNVQKTLIGPLDLKIMHHQGITEKNPNNFVSIYTQHVTDAFRLLGFVLPFATMMALVPIRTHNAGLSATYNALFIALNAIIVICMQLLQLQVKLTSSSTRVIDLLTLTGFVVTTVSLFVDVWLFVFLLIVWSFVEAFQVPLLEHHIFSMRKYDDRTLNRILIMDGIASFIGPIIAGIATMQLPHRQL